MKDKVTFYTASFILTLFLVCGVFAHFGGDAFEYGDVGKNAAYPQFRVFQTLSQQIPQDIRRSSCDLFFGQNQFDIGVGKLPSTAYVDQPYSAKIFVDAESAATFEYVLGPENVVIRQNGERGATISWKPQDEGRHTLCVKAIKSTGELGYLQFTVRVLSGFHPLGTDYDGRDIGVALMSGAKWALFPGILAVSISLLIGVFVGGLSGYYESFWGSIAEMIMVTVESVPAIVVLFIVAVISEQNIWWVMVVLGILMFPRIASLVRARIMQFRNLQFVEAAKELGLSNAQILWKQIIWYNLRPMIFFEALQLFGFAIIMEVTLSLLNLGVKGQSSWGSLLADALNRSAITNGEYWIAVFPTLAIVFCLSSINLMARKLTCWPVNGHSVHNRFIYMPTPESSQPLIQVDNLHVCYYNKSFGVDHVVNGVSFELAEGEALGIIGASGSGKTRIALSLLGLCGYPGVVRGRLF